MAAFLLKYKLLTDFFLNHSLAAAVYDKDGHLVFMNNRMEKEFLQAESKYSLGRELFCYPFLSEAQKESLQTGKEVCITDPVGLIVCPSMDEKGECLGYLMKLFDAPFSTAYKGAPAEQVKEWESMNFKIKKVVTELKDKTEQNENLARQLTESHRMMELALENTRVSTYSFNFQRFRTCDRISCNHCFQFYGQTNSLLRKNQYICRALTTLRHPEDRTDFFYLFNKIREEKLPEYSTIFHLKKDDGEYCSYEVIGKAYDFDKEGYPNLIVGYIIDNQEQVEYEKKLIAEKEKAENADQLKSTFLANVTHDIRTPLHAIVGFSDLLAIETDPVERQNYMNLIRTNQEMLLRLIDDVLDISKIEAGILTFSYAPVEAYSTLKEIYETLKLRTPESIQLILEPCMPYVFNTDGLRFTQIITNLLTNALKYTTEGSIRFGYMGREKEIEFYVSDTGNGIPQEEKQNIFSRFVQLKGNKNGIGLGLAICKGLVNQMGGKIWVESEIGKGSTFRFTLPV